MKKSLVALAAMAFAGVAAAQSSVTLYGIADIYIGDSDAPGSKVAAGSGGVSGSRWGVKGSEDLGGGLKANFNFEQGLNLGNGAANVPAFNRQANLSLSGSFGTIKAGRSGSAMDDMFGNVNSGFDSALSANGVWVSGSSGVDAQLYYATPNFSGFAAAVSTQLTGNAPTGKISSFNLTYGAGPVYAGLGYEEKKGDHKTTILQGSYDLGAAKLLASYATTKPVLTNRVNEYQLGADIPVSGALTVSVGYASSKVSGSGSTARGYGVAAAYSLSKRTTAYAGIRQSNVVGKDLWAVGLKHTF